MVAQSVRPGVVKAHRPHGKKKRHRLRTNGATPINRGVAGTGPHVIVAKRDDDPAKPRQTQNAGPDFGPPALSLESPRGYSPKERDRLPFKREVAYARAMAGRFDRWFLLYIASIGIPLDNVTVPREYLHLLLEAWLLTMASWPGARRTPCLPGCQGEDENGDGCANLRCMGARFCPECEEEREEAELIAPRTEAEAAAAGLTIHRR